MHLPLFHVLYSLYALPYAPTCVLAAMPIVAWTAAETVT